MCVNMFLWTIFSILASLALIVQTSEPALEEEEIIARFKFNEFIREDQRRANIKREAQWIYSSNVTDYNLKRRNQISTENAQFFKENVQDLLKYDYKSFKDNNLKRQFKDITNLNYAALSEVKYKELVDAVGFMETNFARAKVCSYNNLTKCDLSFDPEILRIFSTSRDANELKHYWVEWHNKFGLNKESFQKYIQLSNEAAQLNNKSSGAEAWLDGYEDETFEEQLENIIEQFTPVYKQIHAYMRYKLRQHYGNNIVSEDGPIPMHLLGNMWALTWEYNADITRPYADKPVLDVTDEMVKQGYTPLKMFQLGDEFFQSLNMTALPQTFWNKSIISKPTDGREFICHPTAWDFFKTDDVRIKQCTFINMNQLFSIHHELGHIQYYLQYQHLPFVFRSGANPGFHEAVGDFLALSVSTPKHLQKIGLLKDYVEDEESKINKIYGVGLAKLVFLPYAFTLDKYRWEIFRGNIKPNEYNCKFWKMREQYSGVEPPVVRTEENFDATSKYHISSDVEYSRYLVAFIIQFQFHKAACIKAGEYIPGDPEKTLINCDIYQSKEAGNVLKEMLSLGSSKPWPDAMEVMTGQRKMDVGPLLEYFKPLLDWLVENNKKTGARIGWTTSDKCVRSILDSNMNSA